MYAEGITFLLVKLGTLDWIDAPFHVSMIPENRRRALIEESGACASIDMRICLKEAAADCTLVDRAVSLSPDLTQQLHVLMAEQAKRPMTEIEYIFAVDQAQKNLPMAELMLVKMRTRTQGGA